MKETPCKKAVSYTHLYFRSVPVISMVEFGLSGMMESIINLLELVVAV